MRALAQPRLLRLSAPLGAGLALLCAPLILSQAGDRSLRMLQLASLPVLCVLLLQAALAWTPSEVRRFPGRGPGAGTWSELFLLGAALTAFHLAVDLGLRRVLVLPETRDWGEFAVRFPFAVLVQPLFLVVGVYAFAARLSRGRLAGLAAVLVFHQAVVLLQFRVLGAALVQAALVAAAGLHGLAMGVSYLRHGAPGPAVLSLMAYGRQALYLLFPVLRDAAGG